MIVEVNKEESKVMLTSFQKLKSPSLNGWTMEFLLGFYEMMEEDIFRVVEESRNSGKLLGPMNSTIVALICKKNNLETYEDYMPISLCNTTYKIIAKIISSTLKKVFVESIS
jgi:hypothetical protein